MCGKQYGPISTAKMYSAAFSIVRALPRHIMTSRRHGKFRCISNIILNNALNKCSLGRSPMVIPFISAYLKYWISIVLSGIYGSASVARDGKYLRRSCMGWQYGTHLKLACKKTFTCGVLPVTFHTRMYTY